MNPTVRKFLSALYRMGAIASSGADARFLARDMPLSDKVSHAKWRSHLLALASLWLRPPPMCGTPRSRSWATPTSTSTESSA